MDIDFIKRFYTKERRNIIFFVTILTFMISFTVFSSSGAHINADGGTAPTAIDLSFGENLAQYAGIFSTAVTASVNPTATLAVLSIMGLVQNSETYFPQVDWMVKVGDFLADIPIIGMMKDLPIANPTAAVLLTIIAITIYVLHSTSASKLVSNASIDKIEQWGGMIVMIGISLMPLATQQVVAASDNVQYVSMGTYVVSIILSVLSAIFNAIMYVCIYGCIDALELIASVIPLKGMNLVVEIGRMLLHALLIILQIFSPVLSVIISIIVMITGIILFSYLKTLSVYYTYIYVKPLWKQLFHKNEKTDLKHKKFPKKGEKYYENSFLAIPVFSMNKIGGLKKRKLGWLVMKEGVPFIAHITPFKKPEETPLFSINNGERVYLQKEFRFLRILTESKKVELIFSNEYVNQIDESRNILQLYDYQSVVDRKNQEKAAARSEKERIKLEKRAEREARWQSQFARIGKNNN